MILTDSMLDAAFKFRATEAWNEISDSGIFAAKLSDGTKVYCTVMGNGGTHHSLGIYIGDKGFSTFLNTLSANELSPIDAINLSEEFDCINCDFMQAKDIDDKVKQVIRDYANRNSIKIPRKNGWIDFTRFLPYKAQWCITDERDAFVAEEALRAATFFVGEFKMGRCADVDFDPMGEYPTPKGGKPIPLIVADETGTYHIEETTTPPLYPREYIAPIFDNDILIGKLKSVKKSGRYECRLQNIPLPIKDDNQETSFIPNVFVIVDDTNDSVVMPLTTCDYPDDVQMLLTKLANHLCSFDINPKQITVNDDKTYNLIKDFCHKCDIKLKKEKRMPKLDETCMMLVQQMMCLV